MECVRSQNKTQCQGQVYVGLFFDGTGNNSKWVQKGHTVTQQQRNKHSNVARLFDAHLFEPQNGFFRYYVPGVGTPFDEIGDTSTDDDKAGNGAGYMGADRINWGITSIFNAVHRYLVNADLLTLAEQKSLVNRISIDMLRYGPLGATPLSTEGASRWAALTALEERLAAVARAHQRKITQINLSIFGFSRGAAIARACAHWLSHIFEKQGGGFQLAGIPVRIGFMGLFDTVSAVGVGDMAPFADGHMAWADDTQTIHPLVEDSAHFIALHEQRACFPLEGAARVNVGYPGMHSDVGGGYFPGEQGKSMPHWSASPHLSQLPLMDMHFAAIKAGVPLMTMAEIQKDSRLAKSFSIDKRLLALYNEWLLTHQVSPGSTTAVTQAHAKQYIRWRGMLHAEGKKRLTSMRFYNEAPEADRTDLREADDDLGAQLWWLRVRKNANESFWQTTTERLKTMTRFTVPASRLFIESGKEPLSAHEAQFFGLATEGASPSDATIKLFEDYVHDSRAGFRIMDHHEPIFLTGGYLRFRQVFQERISINSAYELANDSVLIAKSTIQTTKEYLQSLYKASIDTYARARQTAKSAMLRAKNATISAANEATRAYQAAEREVVLKYTQAQKEAWRQFDELSRKTETEATNLGATIERKFEEVSSDVNQAYIDFMNRFRPSL